MSCVLDGYKSTFWTRIYKKKKKRQAASSTVDQSEK